MRGKSSPVVPITRDVLVRNEGTLFLFCPITARAHQWIDEHVQAGALWFGDALVVEHRYAWSLAQGIKDAGWHWREKVSTPTGYCGRKAYRSSIDPNKKEQVMEYMTREELVRLFKVARARNPLHHLAMLVGLLHGLRVSEMLAIHGRDICDGKLSVRRLKKSRPTLHALRIDNRDLLFDESPLLPLAAAHPSERLFNWSRQYTDTIFKRYSAVAGIHPSKAHYHVLKHSICVLLWQETHDLNAIQDHVGHRSSSSTLVYLRADAAEKAQSTIAEMSFGGAAPCASRYANSGTSVAQI